MQVLLYFTRTKVIYFMAFFIAQFIAQGLGARIGMQHPIMILQK
jgi:hypothetical protein